MSAFRIRHLFFPCFDSLLPGLPQASAQVAEGRPAVVNYFFGTVTRNGIPVHAAPRADSRTVIAANLVHGQRKQDVLAEYVFQLHPASLVKPDLAFALVDGYVVWKWSLRSGPVEQIERSADGIRHGFQAPVTLHLEVDMHVTPHSNFPQRIVEKFGLSFCVEITRLPKTLGAKIDLSCRKIGVKPDLPDLELLNAEKQHTPPPLQRGDENPSITSGVAERSIRLTFPRVICGNWGG